MHCPHWWRSCSLFYLPTRQWVWLLGISCAFFLSRAVYAQAPVQAAPGQETPAILLAAGDVAECTHTHHLDTAALLDTLPGEIALLGDSAYPNGSPSDFSGCYDTSWGRHKARTHPVVGNHEYVTPGAEGYFTYFGTAASPLEPDCRRDCKGYYSYELGAWHIVALNSQLAMNAGSEQEQWLRADLAAHPSLCTLAYWHSPRFSSGVHGNDEHSSDVWVALYEVGVDVVLNGHDHNYERFAPQNPAGDLDVARGIREFVVGTGGAVLRDFDHIRANSEARNNQVWGLLQLSLYPDRYEWKFMPVAGQAYEESGSSPCVTVAHSWNSQHFLPALWH